jgi:sedoheptulokinase
MKLAGLDIGTTTLCGLLLEADSGDILSVATEPNAFGLPGTAPWEALQDPDAIFSAAARILDGFLEAHGNIGGIGVAGQMHGILYVDREGSAVSPLFTWLDGRGERDLENGKTCAGLLSEALGRPVSTGMGFVTHYYNVRNGLVPRRAAGLCTIADYVALRLAHAQAPVMDATNAASLGCFDLRRLEFRRDAMSALDIDGAIFPSVSTSYPALGEARTGTPVFAALGDNQASFLGSVRDVRGSLLCNVGTGSQISLFSDECLDVPGIDTRPFPLGGYIGVGAALCGGRAYALLHDFFLRTVQLFSGGSGAAAQGGSARSAAGWDVMNAVDEERLGAAARLTVDTRFSGTRADPGVRGSIANLGPETFTPEHLIVGVREGIADELLGFYERFPEAARGAVTALVGSGNGIRLNPGLQKVFEGRLGMRMRVPAHREETSFGAALLAGVAGKILPDLAAAGRLVRYLSE